VGKRSRADYGVDAPAVVVGLAAAAVVLLGITVVIAVSTAGWWWLIPLAYGLLFGLSCASFLYTPRRGKFVGVGRAAGGAGLTGRERVVDEASHRHSAGGSRRLGFMSTRDVWSAINEGPGQWPWSSWDG
jgi:hypothetical protein